VAAILGAFGAFGAACGNVDREAAGGAPVGSGGGAHDARFIDEESGTSDADTSPGDADANTCVCDRRLSTYGTDPAKTECLCATQMFVPCMPDYDTARSGAQTRCAQEHGIVLFGAKPGCDGPIGIHFSYHCLDATTLFFDPETRLLTGVRYGNDEGSPCGGFETTAGTTTTDFCGACTLCGSACIGSYPPCASGDSS